MDYNMGILIQEAIANYDVSDLINQTMIGCLFIFILAQSTIRIKFTSKKHHYEY